MENKAGLDFEAIAMVDACTAYVSSYEYNGLFRVDLQEEKCEYIGLFPDENVSGKRIHCVAKYLNDKVYFIPASGDYISIFDIEKNIVESVQIPLVERSIFFYNSRYKFIDAAVYGDSLWLIPSSYPGILKFNLNTKELKIIDKWIPESGYFFRRGIYIENDKFYAVSGNNNVVLEFNMKEELASVNYIGVHNNGSMCMCKWGDWFWLAPRLTGSIVKWNPKSGEIKEYTEYPDGFDGGRIVFSQNYCFKDRVYFIPSCANMVLTCSKEDKELKKINFFNIDNDFMIEYLFETNDFYYFRKKANFGKTHFKISKLDNSVEPYSFCITNIDDVKVKWEYFDLAKRRNELLQENDIFDLRDFLDKIVEENMKTVSF